MDSLLFSINDVAEEAKNHREEINKSRRDNYKYNVHLSKNIDPFKKGSIKKFKKTTKTVFKKDMSPKIKPYSCIKPTILNEEILSHNNSQPEINDFELCNMNFELLQEDDSTFETINEFHIDQDVPHSPNVNDESDSTCTSDENLENPSLNLLERELHPFTHISTEDAIVEFLQLIRQSQISKKESEHFLSFIKSLLPFPNQMPKDMNTLLRQLNVIDYFEKKKICILCQKELSNNQRLCDVCDNSEKKYTAHIFDTNISSLLAKILPRLQLNIEEYKRIILNPPPQTPYDIPFAKVYQHLLHNYPKENLLTLFLHVDGISLAKSTKLKLWICDASLVELPPHLRNRRSNMILLSMYIGYSDPNVKIWLKSCFSNINLLKTTEFHVDAVRQSYNIKIYGCIADCPALKLMANINGHNGYYPCFYCYLEGKHIRQAGKRQYTYQSRIIHRTPNSFYLNSRKAQLNNQKVLGHCGISVLDGVVDVPLPHSLVIDYAHVSLLRHFKDVITIVASSLAPAVRTKIDYSLRTQIFPHFFHRKLKGIADFSFTKAIELKNLLLYGFIPHFMRHLTIDRLCFISLFIIGVRLVHDDDIFTPVTSTIANNLLCTYYADHHIFFSYQANFVLHLHQHFQEIYELHGPLSSINTFAQEDFIGYIKKNKNGTTSFENLFSYYYNIDVLLKNFNETNMPHADDGPLDLFILQQGDPLFYHLFEYHEKNCYCDNFYECIKTYRRCLIFKKLYHSIKYIKRKNTNSYCVQYALHPGRLEFGTIKAFFQHEGQIFALIENFQVVNAFSDFLKESRFYELLKRSIDKFYFVIKKTNISRVVLAKNIQKHLIIFEDIIDKALIATPVSTTTEHD